MALAYIGPAFLVALAFSSVHMRYAHSRMSLVLMAALMMLGLHLAHRWIWRRWRREQERRALRSAMDKLEYP